MIAEQAPLCPPHPGTLVKCLLVEDEKGNRINTIKTAAKRIGYSRDAFTRVVSCRARISPRLAVTLEKHTIHPAEFWLDMQSAYDLFQLKNRGKYYPKC